MKIDADGKKEFERFDNTILKLLEVPYKELQRRLKAEERMKKKRKAAKPSASSHASGGGT